MLGASHQRALDGETVQSTKFLGVYITDNFTWTLNTKHITKKAQQRLYFLRKLRRAHLLTFYRGTIESILSSAITAWCGNCTAADLKGPTAEDRQSLSDPPLRHLQHPLSAQSQEHCQGHYRSLPWTLLLTTIW